MIATLGAIVNCVCLGQSTRSLRTYISQVFLLSAQATRAVQNFTKLTKRGMTCIETKTAGGVAGTGSYPKAYAARAKP